MPKQYTKTVLSCTHCPNALMIPTISSDVLAGHERRCKAVIYRNSVYRLIHHGHEPFLPPWCPLGEAETLNPPY